MADSLTPLHEAIDKSLSNQIWHIGMKARAANRRIDRQVNRRQWETGYTLTLMAEAGRDATAAMTRLSAAFVALAEAATPTTTDSPGESTTEGESR